MASDDEISNHGWEVHTYNMSDIPSDKYTILSYESKKTRYGKTYLLTCTPNDGETVLYLWANSYLTDYIEKYIPKKKFSIIIQDKRVAIKGYSQKVILK